MASNNKTVIAFDLYGTLLSTESIAKELATHFGDEKAQFIAALWRRFQLEYTWRMNSMSLYKPFSEITKASLQHALAESSVSLADPDIDSLMKAYDSLSTFPDVAPGLKALAASPSTDAYIFSNGTNTMVRTSVFHSPSLSPFASVFKSLVTVQEIEIYKPDPRVYLHLAKKVGKSTDKTDLEKIWLVSGNPFDIVGAKNAGLKAAWVDRTEKGWNDRLGELGNGGPTIIVSGVNEAVSGIEKWEREHRGRGAN